MKIEVRSPMFASERSIVRSWSVTTGINDIVTADMTSMNMSEPASRSAPLQVVTSGSPRGVSDPIVCRRSVTIIPSLRPLVDFEEQRTQAPATPNAARTR